MKKFFFFAAAVVSMVACQKEAQLSSNEFTAPVEDGTSVAVQFSTNVKSSVAVKGQGSVDSWAGQALYVYGFKRADKVDYTTPFINNVKATAPAAGTEGAIQDLVKNAEGHPFYYEGNNTYDFYGYYVDDADIKAAVAGETGLYHPLTIDGSQDVMLAKADQANDYATALANDTFTGDVANWNVYFAYSAYAARRGVHPTLNFQHQLVQFKFEIESGSDNAVEENLKVVGLELDANLVADFYVAGNDLGLKNAAALYVDEKPVPAQLKGIAAEGYAVPNKPAAAAPLSEACLMVIPNTLQDGVKDTFNGNLYLTQKGAEKTAVPFTLKFEEVVNTPEGLNSFAAGYSFTVKIFVYSLERVEVTAVLTPWENGGNLDIDTDDMPDPINPTPAE